MVPFDDMTPRYTPEEVMTVHHGMRPVVSRRSYPPGSHPEKCCIGNDYTALELVTDTGDSRWYGVAKAWINSELRMVIVGTYAGDEVRMKWEPCCEA